MEDGWEGCLSVPGFRGVVPRYAQLRYRGLRSGRASVIEREVSGFHARVVQHECDHLDGILYPMRMRDFTPLRLHRRAVSRTLPTLRTIDPRRARAGGDAARTYALTLLLLSAASAACAATLTVSPNGPIATIAQAARVARDDDIVEIAAGDLSRRRRRMAAETADDPWHRRHAGAERQRTDRRRQGDLGDP